MQLEPKVEWTQGSPDSETTYVSVDGEIAAAITDLSRSEDAKIQMHLLASYSPKGEILPNRRFVSKEAAKRAAEYFVDEVWLGCSMTTRKNIMKYGNLPVDLGEIHLEPKEVMYYLYLPVSMPRMSHWRTPRQLAFLDELLQKVKASNHKRFTDEYVYVTVKRMFVGGGVTPNRPGWHADGFLTDDLNYVWYDSVPTVFNCSDFKITPDHLKSLEEFEAQADPKNNVVFSTRRLLLLDQTVVHKVGEADKQLMRTFIKVSISKSVYNLQDNSHNYELDYNWPMFNRATVRNDPHRAQQDSATPQSKLVPIDDHFV